MPPGFEVQPLTYAKPALAQTLTTGFPYWDVRRGWSETRHFGLQATIDTRTVSTYNGGEVEGERPAKRTKTSKKYMEATKKILGAEKKPKSSKKREAATRKSQTAVEGWHRRLRSGRVVNKKTPSDHQILFQRKPHALLNAGVVTGCLVKSRASPRPRKPKRNKPHHIGTPLREGARLARPSGKSGTSSRSQTNINFFWLDCQRNTQILNISPNECVFATLISKRPFALCFKSFQDGGGKNWSAVAHIRDEDLP
ncbi:hypothetical protein B0H11DRAFT_1917543 [Mycena galericulata]|nr:hypothetical protein B0H11DRAFT_1917543 [Mycena galericulata]